MAKWLLTSLSVTGGPAGGVPVAVAVLVYWPAVAIRVAVKVQVSVGSSRPSPSASPPTKVASKSSAGFAGVPLSSPSSPGEGRLAGVGHQIGEGHRAAHPGHRTDRAADILSDALARIKGASKLSGPNVRTKSPPDWPSASPSSRSPDRSVNPPAVEPFTVIR